MKRILGLAFLVISGTAAAQAPYNSTTNTNPTQQRLQNEMSTQQQVRQQQLHSQQQNSAQQLQRNNQLHQQDTQRRIQQSQP